MSKNIGILNEGPLHAALKDWYARPEDRLEVSVSGFVIDIVQGDLLVEIQTCSFASIKPKLLELTRAHPVRLVYPIAQQKWIVKLARAEGTPPSRRKSPKRGRVEDVFSELVSFPELLLNPNFSLEVLLIQEEEVRRYEGKRWWRQGWVTEERRLLAVSERTLFETPADIKELLPPGLREPFTTTELADAIEGRRGLAQKIVYCMRKMGVIERVGKRGRSNLYADRRLEHL